ncbi:MAG: hypothetical protein JST11_13230 [Acidobacteria bacterium]|nr:hypothetical protein [Acidobacteriota bacterium]
MLDLLRAENGVGRTELAAGPIIDPIGRGCTDYRCISRYSLSLRVHAAFAGRGSPVRSKWHRPTHFFSAQAVQVTAFLPAG